jgi:hypothetical protein
VNLWFLHIPVLFLFLLFYLTSHSSLPAAAQLLSVDIQIFKEGECVAGFILFQKEDINMHINMDFFGCSFSFARCPAIHPVSG